MATDSWLKVVYIKASEKENLYNVSQRGKKVAWLLHMMEKCKCVCREVDNWTVARARTTPYIRMPAESSVSSIYQAILWRAELPESYVDMLYVCGLKSSLPG